MTRDPRWVQEGGGLDEVTCVVIQNRYLLRPSDELNDLVLGVIGYAQRKCGMRICGLTMLSSHYHMLLWPEDAEQRADFMCLVNTNLSKEVGRLHDWPGTMFPDRYHSVPVSDEEAAQVGRLKYCLANGTKEFLVDRPEEWPGVHSVEALRDGKPLVGHWIDRTKERAARQLRGETPDPETYTTQERVVFSPLPCWAHLPQREVRRRVGELVEEIAEEAARARVREGRRSLGAAKILRARPPHRPKKVEGSEKPRFHAATAAAFKRMWEGYQEIVAAFREASARLLEGDRDAEFPEGTFPPGLPFVPFPLTVLARARGQPA
ncbi:MAG TPA: hypothetical protein VGG06_31100 [Thermoanaerobaculia bacterium]|jgi:hypothetical protein